MEAQSSKKTTFKKLAFIAIGILCLFPLVQPPFALFAGIVLAFTIGHPFYSINGKLTKILLQTSVVGLGFGMNVYDAVEAGKDGLIFTVFSITTTILLGIFLGKIFKTPKKTSILISSGTAICGGSAIAAVSPVIDADQDETSVALGIIFILNSIALFIFPPIGHLLHLDQEQFGFWSAIAIHDTSSVVGAAQRYGDKALQIATTIKLERTLWIIPISIIFAFIFGKGKGKKKISIPYFILYFIIAMLISSFIPQIQPVAEVITFGAKRCLTLTLFLIGAGLSPNTFKQVGVKPLLQGVLLWLFISVLSLAAILWFL